MTENDEPLHGEGLSHPSKDGTSSILSLTNDNKNTSGEDHGLKEPVVVVAVPGNEHQEHEEKQEHNDDGYDYQSYSQQSSMTLALFIYWVLPLLLIAVFSRKLVDTSIPQIKMDNQSSTTHQKTIKGNMGMKRSSDHQKQKPSSKKQRQQQQHQLQFPSHWPSAYRKELELILKRRRYIQGYNGGIHALLEQSGHNSSATTSSANSESRNNSTKAAAGSRKSVTIDETGEMENEVTIKPSRDGRNDATRDKFHEKIREYRKEYKRRPNDIYSAIALAETMRTYDIQFHEGGTYEHETIDLYKKIIDMALMKRNELVALGEPTDISMSQSAQSVPDEVTVEYPSKSVDGLLCSLYTSLGKVYFMANMFELAVDAYDKCLSGTINQPYYLDALNSRASSYIVLGKLEDAGRDYLTVVQQDKQRLFIDSFTGLERILEANEDAVVGGWDSVLPIVQSLVVSIEPQSKNGDTQSRRPVADALNRLYHFLFTYYHKKVKDYPIAFKHLRKGYEYKLSVLPKWVPGSEQMKIEQTKAIFRRGFWSIETGSKTKTPIFIIGFVRSGSTLLERILDAHPMIAGMGENSVFNGRLGDIRDQIVEASNSGESIADLTKKLANDIIHEMHRRHSIVEANTKEEDDTGIAKAKPKRLVDKMLTNYYNIGFIQMLYPNAVIFHIAREPMDSVFSAYKHEFPSGTLDYTSDFEALAELYQTYRSIMEHWDNVLPGRITHIRYEDMVKDFEGTARAIIKAASLPWDDSVLQFHKKKHAVNTLSSTQVRKGVYTDSLRSWMRYEEQLKPLVKLIGKYTEFNFKTSLPGYSPVY